MLCFTVSLLPLALFFCMSKDGADVKTKRILAPSVFGILLGILYSFFDVLFTTSYYLVRYSLLKNIFHFGFLEMIVPVLVMSILYGIFVKKTDMLWYDLFYLFIGFFSIYLPVRIISQHDTFHYFLVFLKPLLYLSSFFYLRRFLRKYAHLLQAGDAKKKILAYILVVFLGLCIVFIPSIVESMWLIGLSPLSWLVLSFLFFIGLPVWIFLDDK